MDGDGPAPASQRRTAQHSHTALRKATDNIQTSGYQKYGAHFRLSRDIPILHEYGNRRRQEYGLCAREHTNIHLPALQPSPCRITLPHSKDGRLVAFFSLRQDWKHTDFSQWTLILPGPRIIYVQRRLTFGLEPEKETKCETCGDGDDDDDWPVPTYFMSPTSSEPIVWMTQTCRESRDVATTNYSLLFPESSTWFSSSADFLHLDFGRSLHGLPYSDNDFATWMAAAPPSRHKPHRYPRPKVDDELLTKVRNLAINLAVFMSGCPRGSGLDDMAHPAISLTKAFPALEVLVIANQLFDICDEEGEELVWTRGQLGDETSSLSLLGKDMCGREIRGESETEKEHRRMMTDLLFWPPSVKHNVFRDQDMDHLARAWDQQSTYDQLEGRQMPTVVRKSIITAKTKDALLRSCGSEDNFQAVTDLDWPYIAGRCDHKGSLDLSQQRRFLELVLASTRAIVANECEICRPHEVPWPEEDGPFWLYQIDQLVRKITRLQEAEGFEGG